MKLCISLNQPSSNQKAGSSCGLPEKEKLFRADGKMGEAECRAISDLHGNLFELLFLEKCKTIYPFPSNVQLSTILQSLIISLEGDAFQVRE